MTEDEFKTIPAYVSPENRQKILELWQETKTYLLE
jgi:hypothetical protein